MDIQYEEEFGVKVDLRIPDSIRAKLYTQWEGWKKGTVKDYLSLSESNLFTRYEHFILGSGIGLPPDPFKPLALQHDGANLEAVVEARRQEFPHGKEYRHSLFSTIIEGFEELTGLELFDYLPAIQIPEMDDEGRIRIPKVVAVYNRGGNKMDLDNSVIAKLQLPTSRDDLELQEGVIVREVFDFDNGYKIEFVRVAEE